MELRLDEGQHQLLVRILDAWIRETKMEIGDTDDRAYRATLRQDKDAALSILEQLDATAASRYRVGT
jgi:hypothetical protein